MEDGPLCEQQPGRLVFSVRSEIVHLSVRVRTNWAVVDRQWLMQSYPQCVCVVLFSYIRMDPNLRAAHHVRTDDFMGTKMLDHEMKSLLLLLFSGEYMG